MALSYTSFSFILNNNSLATEGIVKNCMKIYEKFHSEFDMKKLTNEEKKELIAAGKLGTEFLNEFGFIEVSSEFITKSVILLVNLDIINKENVKVSDFNNNL